MIWYIVLALVAFGAGFLVCSWVASGSLEDDLTQAYWKGFHDGLKAAENLDLLKERVATLGRLAGAKKAGQ